MHACPTCAAHFSEGTCRCPHCGASVCAKSSAGKLPAAALLMGLALGAGVAACQPEYGTAVPVAPDADEDGYDEDVDCDDGDDTIHPEAEETPGDGVDSNCNEDDDT